MSNLLTLHEAIVIVLLGKRNFTSTYQSIANEIERRNLYPIRKGGIELSKQVKLRTSISSSKYKHLFEIISPDILQLKMKNN